MNAWTVQGKYYGFPKCCVDAFESYSHLGEKIPRKLNGTGYIPCKTCNDTKSEDQLLDYIKLHRIEPKPFPHETDYELSVKYMLSSDKFSEEEKNLIKEQFDYNLSCGYSFSDHNTYSYLSLEVNLIADIIYASRSEKIYTRVCDKINNFFSTDFDLQSFKLFNDTLKRELKIVRKVNKLMSQLKS